MKKNLKNLKKIKIYTSKDFKVTYDNTAFLLNWKDQD